MDKASVNRLASEIAGVDNYEERISRETGFAPFMKRNPAMVRDYHVALTIANRLELLVRDSEPPVNFSAPDLADGGLHAPFVMLHANEVILLRHVRACLARSPIHHIEITEDREVVLWSCVYDVEQRKSVLTAVDSSLPRFRRAG